MILIYHLKSLTDEYSIILATWPFGEPPPPLTWPFVAFWLTPPLPLAGHVVSGCPQVEKEVGESGKNFLKSVHMVY